MISRAERVVSSVRRLWRIEGLLSGSAALFAGIAGLLWTGGTSSGFLAGLERALLTLLSAGGAVLALAGVVAAVRAVFFPPGRRRVASWIEDRIPELDDALLTSLEGSAAAAEYAEGRLRGARVLRLLPRGHRVRAGALLAASVSVLWGAYEMRSYGSGTLGPRPAPSPLAISPRGEGAGEGERADSPPQPPRVTVTRKTSARAGSARAEEARLTEVLVEASGEFKRAVELYLTLEAP